MNQRLLRFLDTARATALLLAGAGLLFWLDPLAADPLAPKNFCFAAAAALVAALSAMRLWWGAKLWLPRSKAALAMALVVLAQGAAYLAAPSRELSGPAFHAWLLLFFLVIAFQDWLRIEGREALLMRALALGLALSSLWALAQKLGLEIGPMDARAKAAFGDRVSAGMGNPNFLGGFLVLALPSALWLALRHKAAWWLVALACFAVLATGHKAAWLGLGFQYFAFGHLAWHGPQEREWRLAFIKRWAALGLASFILSLSLLPTARARVLGAFDMRNESVQFRIQTWKGSLAVFASRPLLGHGPGSFFAAYPAHRPQAAMASQLQHSYEVTHPENWILQLLAESGIIGLAAFAAFLWLLLKPLWKAAGLGDPIALCLFLALAGSLIVNLASLDLFLPSSFVFFALLTAAALRFCGPQAGIGLQAEAYAAGLLSFCLIILSMIPALQSFASWRASRSLLQARSLSQSGRFSEALPAYDYALMGDPSNCEALYFKAATLSDLGRPAEALAAFAELQKLAPDYVLVHDKRARALKALNRPSEAAAEWERQLALDPWLLPAIQDLSALYASQGKLADAARILESAQPRFPDNPDIKRNLALIQKAMR